MIQLVDLKKQYKTIKRDVDAAIKNVIKNIDFIRNEITVRGGKGSKDRMTMLPHRGLLSFCSRLIGIGAGRGD